LNAELPGTSTNFRYTLAADTATSLLPRSEHFCREIRKTLHKGR